MEIKNTIERIGKRMNDRHGEPKGAIMLTANQLAEIFGARFVDIGKYGVFVNYENEEVRT
jgi:hypothetical protein